MLDFVFAMSDLIDRGWDYKSWRGKNPQFSHPFGRYVHNYDNNLEMLKGILKEQNPNWQDDTKCPW